ncbi:PREDICTED: prefoldin subunit 6-like isoform X2 [Acropora digitifera]|uniref:prefoldin subunit 6-like n=1 Tax=Acropora millepora TaxID=45264 RepID=UPI00077B235D|nr:PREDICTED: prefoldin subunit 6-like isoform X2 [Acropora digitifera]XP_029198538.1 prefoldin subunit 6-like [Acropora millepora]
MASNMEKVQKQLQSELEKFQGIQKDLQKFISARQRLEAQLNENKVVEEELDVIEPDGNVYKLIGPVLVKQDLEEAKQTVKKRIEYISAELKRNDTSIKEVEKKRSASQEILGKLQQQYQQFLTKVAAKA